MTWSAGSPTRIARVDELIALLAPCAWLRAVLETVSAVDPPEWWVGAGVIRDIVWDEKFGRGFNPAAVKDVDNLTA